MKALRIWTKALIFATLVAVAWSSSCNESMVYDVDIDAFLSGFVKDSRTNAALAGTTVTVQGISVMSDDAGHYSIDKLRTGKTQLLAQREGYEDYTAEVIVEVFTMHDIKMEPK